jgi:Cu-Zn family superoxide dismutase
MKKQPTGKSVKEDGHQNICGSSSICYANLLLMALFLFVSACNSGSKQSKEGESGSQQEQQSRQEEKQTARAQMEPASGSNVTGEATFSEENGTVLFELTVENLSPGEHAVHLHENGDCTAADASSAGGHWNPTMKPHGKRGEGSAFHKGDIGNMTVNNDGKGSLRLSIQGWSIGGADSTNIIGKSVIIHEKADDFASQPSGNAGGRISCGVIKNG